MKLSLDMDISELKNISFGSKVKPENIKYPTKRTINLAMKEDMGNKRGLLIGGLILALLLLAVGVKFGVIDQYAKLNEAQAAYDALYEQRVALEEKLLTYDEVEQEYRSYSRDWLTEDTTGKYVSVDRLEVLDMLERVVFYNGIITDFSVTGSEVSLVMSGMDLQEISDMFVALQEEPLVAGAVLQMASTSEAQTDNDVSFSLTVTLVGAVEEVAE